MTNIKEHIHKEGQIPEDCSGLRLDQALARLFPDYSRSRLQQWITHNQVTVNGQSLRPKDRVYGGETFCIQAEIEIVQENEPQNIPLTIVFEDEHIIVVNKPIGLVVHPGAGNQQFTLLNALLHHCPSLNQLPRAGIIHRLDKNTSGLMVIAKTLTAHTALVRELQNRDILREYDAIVQGNLISGGTVDAPMGRDPHQRTKMAVRDDGKEAVTHYRVIKRFHYYTWVHLKLETGRTHQIRVHMAHIKHPLLGDPTYGGRLKLPKNCDDVLAQALRDFKHQALHASKLGLTHPVTKEYLEWSAPLPDNMQQMIHILSDKYD